MIFGKHYLMALMLLFGFFVNAQEPTQNRYTENVWRINFVNPGAEFEMATGSMSTLSVGAGIGYSGSYPELSFQNQNGFQYLISPFLDVQEKWFYNFRKRQLRNKSTKNNSGNFVSLRMLARGNAIASNFDRTSELDFAFGPTWGIQRRYGKNFHFLLDVGPIYYMDTNGNGNIFPIMIQINLGLDL